MNTRIFVMIVGLTLLVGSTLWAQFQDSGRQGRTTVSAAKEAADDTWVSLTGTIVRRVEGDRYLFRDATGDMIVEIDHDDWGPVTAIPETTLRITGEVDREWFDTEIDVETIEAVNPRSQKPLVKPSKLEQRGAIQGGTPAIEKTNAMWMALH
ncbi:MAG: NirD/YgiW/YdeI family stress tolerance protein [Nitrospirales bacterium]|nr:NirD/YgiW/YdeI family stress tolerance protein [Nitrospirales bacterium]